MGCSLPCIFTGFVFYVFGLKWLYENAKYWITVRDDMNTNKFGRYVEKCRKFLSNYPIEGSLKLVATAVGIHDTLTVCPSVFVTVSPKVALATLYLFFAFSGLVDVLHFYFPHSVGDGLVKLALAQSFFIEGYLFLWGNVGTNTNVDSILALIVWTTSLAIALELVWPEVKLLRSWATLLHGSWMAHMIHMSQSKTMLADSVALAFSWHIAAASAVTLCITAAIRSCAPKLIMRGSPGTPIYDYCQEPD